MMISKRTGLTGSILASVLLVSACSDSSSPPSTADSETLETGIGLEDSPPPEADFPATDPSGTDQTNSLPANSPGTDSTANPAGEGTGTDTLTSQQSGDSPASGTDELTELATPSAAGNDLSGGDDDSPTVTESVSLSGPFTKDPSRPAGPPSSPGGLTLLLSAENWLEFTWTPSTDDQSVVAYEIYRDGTRIATVRGDTGYEHDLRSWLSTSFIDCNFTRYTDCDGRQPVPGASYSYTVVAVDNQGMRSAPSAPALFTLQQGGSSPPDLSGYAQVFSEEFKGTALDRTRWKTALPWGPDTTVNGEMQYFVNVFGANPPAHDPFVFTGETLQITGTRTPPELLSAANGNPYLSGVITTSDYFEMTYGYVEMSAKVAGGQGLLSTFYLFNQDYFKNKPEIDIVEYIGSRPDKAYQTYHYYDSNRARSHSGEKHSSPTMETLAHENLSGGFHTYSVLWEPGLVVWYIDGQEVRRISGPRVSDEPMNIIAHLVMGSDWIGSPSEGALPATFEIDYIRAWQRQ
ncbi:MAG: family 16 glycosylhydrolase [Granulosicoccus sp.]|nr:family 16 glycosylhydrolase [Granulosicoccus sp.]